MDVYTFYLQIGCMSLKNFLQDIQNSIAAAEYSLQPTEDACRNFFRIKKLLIYS